MTTDDLEPLPLAALERIDETCERFERAWRGGRPDLRDFLAGAGAERQALFRELLKVEVEYRQKRGEFPLVAEYRDRFPDEDVGAALAGLPGGRPPGDDATAVEPAGSKPTPSPPAVAIPGYEILGRLGSGGMGVVYKARHLGLGRVVALKLIRSGDQASEVELARFRTEALAAARLQHPNVVQVFEAGEANGQPFLCMEYVEGESLARAIDGTPWPAERAAGLVETLARAIDAAHRQGIVHRDLKPGNVLLPFSRDAKRSAEPGALPFGSRLNVGEAKITDFGLAKLLEGGPAQTATGTFLGSPSYAAPEQAGAHHNAIGPHTDIYALGAVLYELLTARPPFLGSTLLDTIRQVTDQEPVPPRLLNPAVPTDLEAICLKCLEKPPARRYRRAADLADDLARWQRHEPTHARPPGPLGRALRWCRRHPAATAIVAVVALGVLGMAWQWREAVAAGRLAHQRRLEAEQAERDADAARKDAEEEAAAAREVANFLGGLFEEADPFVLTPRAFGEQPITNPNALDIMDRAAKRLADPTMIRQKPLVRAALLDKVGHAYVSLGAGAKAAPFVAEALEIRRKHLPGDHADLATSLHDAGFLALTRRDLKRSQELFNEALAMRTRLFGSGSVQAMTTRYHLGLVKVATNDPAAEPLLAEVVEFQRARLKAAEAAGQGAVGAEAMELAFTLITLCNCHAMLGRAVNALPYLAEAQEVSRKVPNKDLAALANQVIAFRRYQAFGQKDKADAAVRQALGTIERHAGKHHFAYQALQGELGYMYFHQGRYEEAEKVFCDLEGTYVQAVGDGPGLARIRYEIARSIARGALVKAASDRRRELRARVERYARSAYQLEKKHGSDGQSLGTYGTFLAFTLLQLRAEPDAAGAEEPAREAVRVRTAQYGVGHTMTAHPRSFLILSLARQDKVNEIEALVLDLLARDPRPKWEESAATSLPEAARKLALAGKAKTALLLLEQAAASGHYNLAGARADLAFASLRDLPEFRKLLEKWAK